MSVSLANRYFYIHKPQNRERWTSLKKLCSLVVFVMIETFVFIMVPYGVGEKSQSSP